MTRDGDVQEGWLTSEVRGDVKHISVGGAWVIRYAAALDQRIADATAHSSNKVVLDMANVQPLDSAGAFLLSRLGDRVQSNGGVFEAINVAPHHAPLLGLVDERRLVAEEKRHTNPLLALLEGLGRTTVEISRKAIELLNFVGLVAIAFARTVVQPRRFRPKALVTQIEQTGLNALPIVGLLTFLVGVVLAYLMSDQLRQFGAEVFTVNLVGLSILREVGVLITAIMIAGRSGSAFTAQIGTMKVNEEVDAMQTLGLDPIEVLVLPRVLALMITLPILTFFADVMGILGGGVMVVLVLDISAAQFVSALQNAVDINDFLVGIVKAPVHAYIIAIVGCYEGLKVQRTAESVGRQTTVSVVESIFLVIVATSLFSILFSVLGV